MATINYVIENDTARDYVKVEWVDLAQGDVGQPFECAGLKMTSVHIWGTFDGANMNLECSNRISPSDFVAITGVTAPGFIGPESANMDHMNSFGALRPVVVSGGSPSVSMAILFRRA